MSRVPIRLRITAWFVGVLAVVLIALGAFVTTSLRSDLTAGVDRSLTGAADTIARGYREEGAAEFADATREVLETPGGRILGAQIVGGGVVVRSAGDPLLDRPVLPAATVAGLEGAPYTGSRRIGPDATHVRAIAVPVTVSGRREALVVVERLDQTDRAVRRTELLLAVGGLAGLLVAAAGGWWVAGRAMRPVRRITQRAAGVDITGLGGRVEVPAANDELRALAGTLNGMLARLEEGVATRERLIADASHELRGPLAAMRAELEVSLRHDDADGAREALRSVHDDVVRLSRIVDNLLTLARIDADGLALLRRPEDLRDLAAGVVRAHRAAASETGVRLEIRGGPAAAVCDGDRISQVLGNLLDNAARVSPAGAVVEVESTTTDGEVLLMVHDRGPGIPADQRDAVFARFARIGNVRGRDGGAGLGLAISHEIVAAHGGRLECRPRHGGGTTFVVSLPAPPA